MKKVYLVTVSLGFEAGFNYRVILHIFSSKRKALVYRDFKRLKVERDGIPACFSSPGLSDSSIVSADIRIEEHFICSLDWSDELKELQDEKFNNVIAPKDIAPLERSIASLDTCPAANRLTEEQRNIELTKKYNLLDFV